jgi:hypothetical protein
MGKGIELAFHCCVMPGEDIRQRLDCRIVRIAPCHFGKLVAEIDPELVLPLLGHD